jgi:hypothetical protein
MTGKPIDAASAREATQDRPSRRREAIRKIATAAAVPAVIGGMTLATLRVAQAE